ncbi:MAG: lipid-A-disaccharide synthase, partial [Cytophagia bacterium]|nr:lipid-A-disaccharide synthase [Cytophagia bacterium]
NGAKREQTLEDYQLLREKLGGPGASKRVAELMIGELSKKENS